MKPDELELWERYGRDRDDATRNAIAERYLGLVKRTAKQIKLAPYGTVDFDGLIAVGCVGLLSAIATFDLARGWEPSTYFRRRIYGAMIDELRKNDFVSRGHRIQITATRELGKRLGYEPTVDELSRELGFDRDTALTSLAVAYARRSADYEHASVEADESLERDDWRSHLLRGLTPSERTALAGYYFDGLTQAEVAKRLGVGPSRISQIIKDALSRLRSIRCYEKEAA